MLTALTILDDAFGVWAQVSTSLPTKQVRPQRFVRVSRVGGGQGDPATDTARLLVECFGPDTATVEAMCNTARAALRNARGITVNCHYASGDVVEVFVRSWDGEQGPVDFPHPDILDRERWQFHGDFAVKAN